MNGGAPFALALAELGGFWGRAFFAWLSRTGHNAVVDGEGRVQSVTGDEFIEARGRVVGPAPARG